MDQRIPVTPMSSVLNDALWNGLENFEIVLLTFFFLIIIFQSEFICGLLKVVVEKMEHSIPTIIDDDNAFSHFIDELLLFDKELYMVHNYRSIEHGCLHVLTSDACLQRWVELERKCKPCYSIKNCSLKKPKQLPPSLCLVMKLGQR